MLKIGVWWVTMQFNYWKANGINFRVAKFYAIQDGINVAPVRLMLSFDWPGGSRVLVVNYSN